MKTLKFKSFIKAFICIALVFGYPTIGYALGEKPDESHSETEQQPDNANRIRGVVLDSKTNEPIIGASVKLEKVSAVSGTITNADGEFNIACKTGDVLIISYIGYETKKLTVSEQRIYVIELFESTEMLEDVVITAYGTGQKKASLVGSISQVKPTELKVPSSTLSSSFAGRLAGVIAVQRSGEPGADGANFWIRGKSTFSGATDVLIILDGVEISQYQLNRLDPEAIESFSILKDATATALYGTRGANGVMIVTTKSGRNLEKPIINIRVEGSVNQMTNVAEMVGGVEYMQLYNEAASRPGSGALPYSEDKIQGTMKGLNPYLYPNVDWYNEMFKKYSYTQRANFNIRGGSKRVDYFMSGSFRHSDGNLRPLSKKYFSYDNSIKYYNYEFVNNLNVHATSSTKVSLGLNFSIQDWDRPDMNTNDIFGLARVANPVDFPITFPAGAANYDTILWGDKSGGPYDNGYRNPIAEYVTGYRSQFESTITANFKLEQDLGMFIKGLRFSGLFSFKNSSITNINRKGKYNRFEVESYDPATMDYTLRRIGTENSTELQYSRTYNGDRRQYLQAMFEYNRIFSGVHDVNMMLLYNQQQSDNSNPDNFLNSLPKRKQGIAGRMSYSYGGRYLAEANFGYNGSENFAKGHRFGFFPSFAIGYNLSEEKYWAPLSPYVSKLKIRASWGLVGNDNTGMGRFAYLENLSLGAVGSYTMGIDQNVTLSGPQWSRLLNEDLTWEVGEKINLGIDLQLFKALDLTVDIFKETRRNIFINRTSVPNILGMGGTTLSSNLGKMRNEGIDASVDYNKQINKDFYLSFKGTFTYAHNTILERDEPPFREYPNLSSVGHSMGQNLCLVAKGLFPDEETIKNSPVQKLGYAPMPGDIWYVDQPNYLGEYDNVIDNNDRVYMGFPADPEIVYGFGSSMKWKNWDLSFFFQGVARTSLMMSGFHPFGSTTLYGLAKFIAEDRWTEENQNVNAKYPRLTIENNTNTDRASSFWLRDGSFLKLKNAEIGYTYKNMRLYLSGSNLLTFSPFKHWDPEMGGANGLKYPTQRVFNIGLQMTFNNK